MIYKTKYSKFFTLLGIETFIYMDSPNERIYSYGNMFMDIIEIMEDYPRLW